MQGRLSVPEMKVELEMDQPKNTEGKGKQEKKNRTFSQKWVFNGGTGRNWKVEG